jgi:cysteine synthase A
MMKVVDSILKITGSTPIVRLSRIARNVDATLYAKLEYLNPTGSVKDRIAVYMIECAERKGILKHNSTILEATTGNTGISFAWAAAVKGYKMIVVMPEGMSEERKKIISAFGADIIYTTGGESDVDKTLKKVEELKSKIPNVWVPGQFTNFDNVTAHELTTGREIIQQLDGRIDAFVAAIGTGGTLMGVARALRKLKREIKIIAVEPAECPIITKGKWGSHRIEGIGDGFIPDIVDVNVFDDVITVSDADAIEMAKRLAREEGLLVGISSGCNVCAALEVGKKIGKNKVVVTVLPDSAQRYFSTDLFK